MPTWWPAPTGWCCPATAPFPPVPPPCAATRAYIRRWVSSVLNYQALVEAVETRGRPFLGICVGMQLMASWGREYEDTPGLGWIAGEVVRIAPSDPALKVPHMGWNDLVIDAAHPVFDGIASGDHAYFVHSYQVHVADPADRLAHVDYGGDVTAVIGRGTMLGMQFHPEKSQSAGLRMIANFLSWTP